VVALRLEVSLPAAVTGPVCEWTFAICARVWLSERRGKGRFGW
jgi:hypothetical protein